MTSEQNLNLVKTEKIDLILLKNEIVILNLNANKNIFTTTYQSSIYDGSEVAVKKENSILIPIDIKTKNPVTGGNSILVEACRHFQLLNYYDPVKNQFVQKTI